jgi:outer membrane protein assembly factor BamB
MSWKLLKEVGVEYVPLSPGQPPQHLTLPNVVERCNDGSHLVVDLLSLGKSLTVALECRTLRISPLGEILYDSLASGIQDGYGCAIDDGLTAILRRSTWELLIVADDGTVQDRIPLWPLSKHMPHVVSWSARKTFLISFVDKVYDVDIIEVDIRGRLLWYLRAGEARIGCPASVQLLENDNILVADDFAHVALEIRRQGDVVWQYGAAGDPSNHIDRLSSPGCIRELCDGRRIVADTRNHRILVIDTSGKVTQLTPSDGRLCSPMFADLCSDGHWLIADAGNRRTIELDRGQNIVWQYGNLAVGRRTLSFPRSVEPISNGNLLVADTANNRVLEVNHEMVRPWPIGDSTPLFWPRAARHLASGGLLIADGRNGRVIQVSAQGEILNMLGELDLLHCRRLKDPHDVRLLPDGRLLLVDPSNNLVVMADWTGHVSWSAGTEATVKLKDPHSAQLLTDGTVLICDSGNHRLLYVDENGKAVRCVESFYGGKECFKLNRPRYAEVGRDNVLVVVDTANNRVLAADIGGELVWTLSTIPCSPIATLDQPRWAHLVSRDEVLVCDHYNHRILHLRYERNSATT